MAARTIQAIAALVTIILCVAADAGGWRLGHFRCLFVAPFAHHSAVGALQGKAGHRVVIETGLLPAARIVAIAAIGAIGAFVAIVAGVAGHTGARGMLVGIAGPVALRASCPSMSANQRKPGGSMIERSGLPARGGMARSAIGAAATAVCIIAGMTGNTGARQILPALPGMTAHAGLGPVRAG